MRTGWHIAAIVVLTAAASAGGCQTKGGRDVAAMNGGEPWPFVPVAVRIHPFTSITAGADGLLTLEARLEFVDSVGDVTKGVGDIRFELYGEAATAQDAGHDRQIMVWEAPLTSLDHNRRHYDPITRTYIFKLKLTEPLPPGRRIRLDVQVTDLGGQRMTATSPINGPSPAADSAPAEKR